MSHAPLLSTSVLALLASIPLVATAQTPQPGEIAKSAQTSGKAGVNKSATPLTDAEKTIDEAIERLKKVETVKSDVLMNVDMLGQSFRVRGAYMRAPKNRFRLDLAIEGLGDANGVMLQVCDGKVRWNYQHILEAQGCDKLEIDKFLEKLKAFEPTEREMILSRMGFAGPDALLGGLRKAIHFDSQKSDTLDGRDVWVLRGAWTEANRAALNMPGQGPLPAVGPLPPYIPNLATLWLGKKDGWPYQVELRGMSRSILETGPLDKKTADAPGADGKPKTDVPPAAGPFSLDTPSKMLLKYSNVSFNPKDLKAESFLFTPPENIRPIDLTPDALADLERLGDEMARRKAAAAEASDNAGGASDLPPVDLPKKKDAEPK